MSTANADTLLLIDGHSLAFRAFYALPVENFTTSTGQHTNAVYGFMSMLLNVVAAEEPTHLAVSFDLGKPTVRLAQYPEYKAGRKPTPPEFAGQVDLLIDLLKALRVPIVTLEGHEADDVIATLAAQAREAGISSLIISGDRDCMQLVNDSTTLLYPKRGVSDLARMTPEAVEEKYGVSPENYPGLAALVGETADNLPGVPGVGEKTAAKWLAAHGDLDGVIAHADQIGGKAGERLREHLDQVVRNQRLNRLETALPLPVGVAETRRQEADFAAVEELFDVLEFRALKERFERAFGAPDRTGGDASQPEEEIPPRVLDAAGFRELIESIGPEEIVALAGDGHYALGHGDVTRLAIARAALEETLDQESHPGGAVELADLDPAAEQALARLLTENPRRLVFHGAKTQLKAFHERGLIDLAALNPEQAPLDTELAAYVLRPELRGYGLDDLAARYLGRSLEPDSADGEQLALDLDGGEAELLALARRARAVLDLHTELAARLEQEEGTRAVFSELEVPTVAILAKAELAGVQIDRELLGELVSDYRARGERSAEAAFEAIGERINLGSPKQLQVVLFETLGMRKTKRTKTGYTTDADSLAELYAETQHPFLEHVLAYRDATKLVQILEGLGRSIADDGRIHTTYQQTVAATGRLSSTDPNLQNIPVRTEAGRRIRELFIAGPGYERLLTADYSQIEMRIMAHLSGDAGLQEAYREGEDLHNYVGAQVFGVGAEDVTLEMRARVKAMSYGLAYGLSAYGLSKQLGIGVDEARALMTGYFERFGGVKRYLDEVVDRARRSGYTETLFGRRRYLPDLSSDNRQRREMAERAALNAPIQGSAADIMKRAMIGVDRELTGQRLGSRVLLQVHDELILEIAPGEYEQAAAIVREQMGSAAELDVPLDVNIGSGASWHAAAH
ncbi:DNA polymerase I [Sediminivirga luteola]|uniref:DNA polymerase I n=1 Tax=Sediminivirga luteola TaxID=1774748 RepID=UPI001F56E615|nr:DNA polymerase I [Sediminivirga luteola]